MHPISERGPNATVWGKSSVQDSMVCVQDSMVSVQDPMFSVQDFKPVRAKPWGAQGEIQGAHGICNRMVPIDGSRPAVQDYMASV